MATYDLTKTEAGWAYEAMPGGDPTFRLAKAIDFSKLNGGAGTAAGDVIKIIKIPANTIVQTVAYRVWKASANLASLDIGDATTATKFVTALDLTAIKDGVAALTPAFYTDEDYVALKQNTAATVITGILEVMVLCWDANGYKGDLKLS